MPLSLTLRLPAAFVDSSIGWFSDQVALAGLNLTVPDITIPPALLPQGGLFTISANVSLSGQTGTATISVPVNSAPYCSAGASTCFAVTAASTTFPTAQFQATAVNFADDGGASNLKYEYGLMVNNQPMPLLIDRVTAFTFTNLAQGTNILYVRAVDVEQASILLSYSATVQAPASNFNASTALAGLDVGRAVATGDPAAISQAAMAITALAQYAFLTTSTTSGSNTSTTNQAVAQAAAQVVDSKASTVLLASASNIDKNDPAAATTCASTAASVVKVMTNMDDATKKAVLDIGKNREHGMRPLALLCVPAGFGGACSCGVCAEVLD